MIWYLLLPFTLGFQAEIVIDEATLVDVALIDVLVLDAEGQPIRGLTQKDFQVFEDQRERPIHYFEFLDFRDPGRLGSSKDDPAMQTVVLILDLVRMDLSATRKTLQAVRHFLEQQPARLPAQTMLFSFDTGSITAGFTRERTAVLDDFTQFEINYLNRRESLPAIHEPFHLSALEKELHQCIPKMQGAPSAWRSASAGTMGRNCLQAAYEHFQGRHSNQTQAVLSGLGQVLESLAGIEGLKSIYFISPGFSLTPSESGSQFASRYMQIINTSQSSGLLPASSLAPGVQAEGPESQPDLNQILSRRAPVATKFSLHNLESELLQLAHLAFENRTVIHTFSVTQNFLADRQNHPFANSDATHSAFAGIYQSFALELDYGPLALAKATGGLHTRDRQMESHLQQTFQSSSLYYVLGYAPHPKKGKKFKRLRVECNHPGSTVFTQSGYYRRRR